MTEIVWSVKWCCDMYWYINRTSVYDFGYYLATIKNVKTQKYFLVYMKCTSVHFCWVLWYIIHSLTLEFSYEKYLSSNLFFFLQKIRRTILLLNILMVLFFIEKCHVLDVLTCVRFFQTDEKIIRIEFISTHLSKLRPCWSYMPVV